MALRAGYHGIKKKLYDQLNHYDETILSLVPKTEQAALGAVNVLYNVEGTTKTVNGVTFTVNADKSITVSGTATADARFYFWNQSTSSSKPHYNIPDGDWYLKGATADMPNMVRLELAFFDGSTYKKAVRSKNDDLTPKFTINHSVSDGWDTSCCILVPNGTVFSAAKTFKPQISFSADDPYVMFAMTNRSLTLSAVDQRDMINSIISAATGAADFAAFKTAMGAITPATRSLALSEKTLDAPELTEDEPIVKKTTRKATKKTEEV